VDDRSFTGYVQSLTEVIQLIDIVDPSLLSLVERLLPLATYFTSVEAYMELRLVKWTDDSTMLMCRRNTPEYGMVSHALGSGIRSMLKVSAVRSAHSKRLTST
jgi:gamma-tubulin complex component 2